MSDWRDLAETETFRTLFEDPKSPVAVRLAELERALLGNIDMDDRTRLHAQGIRTGILFVLSSVTEMQTNPPANATTERPSGRPRRRMA